MKVRRIVTGRDRDGTSTFWSVSHAPRSLNYVHIPGMSNTQVWSTPPNPSLDAPLEDPTPNPKTVLPAPGGTQLMIVRFPPDSVMRSPQFNPAAAAAENLHWLPGLAECFEQDAPGMHTTDTIDYGIVLAGEIWLELDDGLTEKLREHDVVVQHGTRHAWRNKTEHEAIVAFVLIGARRSNQRVSR
jgi:hypothetical protein